MAITPFQRTLRARLAVCRTATEVHAIVDALPPETAESTWQHIGIATPTFDDRLIARLYPHPQACVNMARNRGLTAVQREALFARLTRTLDHPAIWLIMGAACRTGRLRFASPAGQHLLGHVRARAGLTHCAAEWLCTTRDLPDAVRGEVAARIYAPPHGTNVLLAEHLIGRRPQWADDAPGTSYVAHLAPSAFASRFRGAAAVSPVAAAHLLLDRPTPEQLALLTTADLAPCLAAAEARTRELAALALGGIRPPGTEALPPRGGRSAARTTPRR